MYKRMNSTQKSVFKIIVPFLLFTIIFVVCFNACKNVEEEENTTKNNITQSTADEFYIPEIENEIPAVDDTYVIETQKNDDVYTFNYETRSPDEIIKGDYLTVAQITTLPFSQVTTMETVEEME